MSTIFDQLNNVVATATYDRFFGFGSSAYDAAMQAVQGLASADFAQAPTSVNFNPVGGAGSFLAPPAPTGSVGPFIYPEPVPDFEIRDVTLEPPRDLIEPTAPKPYEFRMPGSQPDALRATRPGDAPRVADVTLPASRSFTLPDSPTFYDIDLPTFDGLTLPTFDAEAPEIDFPIPTETFAFTERDYSSTLLTATQERLAAMLEGGTGLPAAIEQALFDRARTREDTNALRALQEVDEEFANRGWSEPTGMHAKRRREVRQNNQNQQNALSREILIESAKIEVENLRFAVAQGIALEQVLLSAHLSAEQRRFEVARFAFEAVLSIFNARVELHNARVRGYEAAAKVHRDLIDAEIAKVQAFKAEIEAQATIGQMNETLGRLYESQVRGVLAEIEAYKAEFTAALSSLEVDKARIDAHRSQVASYREIVGAWGAEWEAYNSRVRAELGHATAAEIAERSYATRVSAWNTQWQVSFERLRSGIQTQDLKLRKFSSEMQRYLGQIEAERSRVAAQAQALGAEAQVYAAGGQIAAAQSAAHDRSFQLELERGRAAADLQLKNAEINLQASLQSAGYTLQAQQTVAQVTGQLAASALSAINVSGSLSGSLSNITSYSYSGDIP